MLTVPLTSADGTLCLTSFSPLWNSKKATYRQVVFLSQLLTSKIQTVQLHHLGEFSELTFFEPLLVGAGQFGTMFLGH